MKSKLILVALTGIILSVSSFAAEMPQTEEEWNKYRQQKIFEMGKKYREWYASLKESKRVKAIIDTSKATSGFAYDAVFDPTALCERMQDSSQELSSANWFMHTGDVIQSQAEMGNQLAEKLIESWGPQMAKLKPSAAGFIDENNQFDFSNLKLYDYPNKSNFGETWESFWKKHQTAGFASYRCFRFNESMVKNLEETNKFMYGQGYDLWLENTLAMVKEPQFHEPN